MNRSDFEKLLAQNTAHLSKLNDIVQQSLQEEEFLVNKLLHPEKEQLSFAENLSDKIARFGGSWKFIISFGVILACWILFNIVSPHKFDAYPFILLNLLLGGLAALQAPFIMMSQNRQAEKDRLKTDNDYMINLKAELEIRSLHQKINIMMQDQSKIILESQAMQVQYINEISEKSLLINEQQTRAIERLSLKVDSLSHRWLNLSLWNAIPLSGTLFNNTHHTGKYWIIENQELPNCESCKKYLLAFKNDVKVILT